VQQQSIKPFVVHKTDLQQPEERTTVTQILQYSCNEYYFVTCLSDVKRKYYSY